MIFNLDQIRYKINDLINEIFQIAEEYDSTKTYAVDDYCTYEGKILRCTSATSGAFDSSAWTDAVIVMDVIKAIKARLTAAESNISTAQSDISAAQSDISAAQDDISALNLSLAQCVKDYARFQETSLAAFESTLLSRLNAMSDYEVRIGMLRSNYSGTSPTNGAWAVGILMRISDAFYKCDIPDTCTSGYYYSGTWHWTKATMATMA